MSETQYASFEDLTAEPAEDGVDVHLPSGKVVRARGLTRYELMVTGKGEPDNALYERRMVSACLIQPRLTLAQVEAWQKRDRAGGDLAALTIRIRDMSGLGEGADKSALRAVRDES